MFVNTNIRHWLVMLVVKFIEERTFIRDNGADVKGFSVFKLD